MIKEYSAVSGFVLLFWLVLAGPVWAQTMPEKRSIDEFESYLSLLEKKDFSGVILLSKDGQSLFSKSLGMADREHKIPNTLQTVFEIGSTSKQFTAFAISDLAVDSKLSFSDPLSKFFENVPADKKNITIHQLLTHSSGLEMYQDQKGPLEKIDRTEALKRIFNQRLKFAPGEKYDYSNSGYSLLGLIIEKITGEDFKSYLKKLLFEKAQIKIGFYGDQDWERQMIACGYSFGKNDHPFDRGMVTWGGLGAGYMMLDAEDYLKWIQFLTSDLSLEKYGKYLFKEYYLYPSVAAKAFYGYGWVILYKGEEKIIYHNGGDTSLGYISTIRYYPGRNMILVILSNNFSYEPHKIFEIKNKIEDLFIFRKLIFVQ